MEEKSSKVVRRLIQVHTPANQLSDAHLNPETL